MSWTNGAVNRCQPATCWIANHCTGSTSWHCECVGHYWSQVRFRVLLPVAVACWAAAATLAPQFCADNTVAWLGLTGSPCTAAAMALQVQHSVHSPLSRGMLQMLAPLSAVKAG